MIHQYSKTHFSMRIGSFSFDMTITPLKEGEEPPKKERGTNRPAQISVTSMLDEEDQKAWDWLREKEGLDIEATWFEVDTDDGKASDARVLINFANKSDAVMFKTKFGAKRITPPQEAKIIVAPE